MSTIQLYKGDCLEVMPTIADKSVDMVLCDLPYGITQCRWDSVIPFDRLWEHYNRIIKPNGCVVLFGSEPFSSALRMSNIENYRYDWIWKKPKGVGHLNAKKQPLNDYETISVFYSHKCKYNPQFTKGTPYTQKSGKVTKIYGGGGERCTGRTKTAQIAGLIMMVLDTQNGLLNLE